GGSAGTHGKSRRNSCRYPEAASRFSDGETRCEYRDGRKPGGFHSRIYGICSGHLSSADGRVPAAGGGYSGEGYQRGVSDLRSGSTGLPGTEEGTPAECL